MLISESGKRKTDCNPLSGGLRLAQAVSVRSRNNALKTAQDSCRPHTLVIRSSERLKRLRHAVSRGSQFPRGDQGSADLDCPGLSEVSKISAAVANRVIPFLRVQGYVEPATLLQRAIRDEIKFPSSKSWDQLCPHKLGWNRAANLGCSATSNDGETVSGLQPLTTLDPT
jgi:hypothetical protein